MSGLVDKLTDEIKSQLTWTLDVRELEKNSYSCQSHSRYKYHMILIPKDKTDIFYDLNVLHEHVHAFYNENLPEVFVYFDDTFANTFSDSRGLAKMCLDIINDWFVAGWLIQHCPSEYKNQIDHCYKQVKEEYRDDIDDGQLLTTALSLAEAIKWLHCPACGDTRLIRVCNKLLRVSPKRPTVHKKRDLLEGLAKKFGLTIL